MSAQARAEEARKALDRAGAPTLRLDRYDGRHANGVLVGTFHRAKGLEFKEVFAFRLGDAHWPARGLVPPGLAAEEREERLRIQTRALHVALTRARERLVLLATGDPAAPVRRARHLLELIDAREGGTR